MKDSGYMKQSLKHDIDQESNPMFKTMLVLIAGYSAGRIMLHLICVCQNKHWRFHLQGIKRELLRR